MTLHPEAPRKGLGVWLTMVTGVVAAALLVWGIFEIARVRIDARPSATSMETADDTLASLPAGTRLYSEVFSVSDAALHGGTWFVLDRRGSQIHRISESGDLLGSFGQRGEGPGELIRPVAIASHGDTVVVLDRGDLHLFDLDGRHLADRSLALGGCPTGVARDLLSRPRGLFFLIECREGGRLAWLVVLEAAEGSRETLAVRAGDRGVVDMGMVSPVFAAHPLGFVFGLASDECLKIVTSQGEESNEVCHDWIERLPIPRAPQDPIAAARANARRSGIRLVEHNRLPPFVQVFVIGGELVYQVPRPEDLETFRLVRRGTAGEAVALPLPVAEGQYVAGNSVLLWWEDIEGTRMAFRRLGTP